MPRLHSRDDSDPECTSTLYYAFGDEGLVFVDWDKYNSGTVKRRVTTTSVGEICPQ